MFQQQMYTQQQKYSGQTGAIDYGDHLMQKNQVVEDYSSNFPLSNIQHQQDQQYQKQRHSVKVGGQDQFSCKRGSAPSAPGGSHLPYHQHHSHQPSQSSAVAAIEDDFKNQTTPGANHNDDPNYQNSEQKRQLRQMKNLQKLQKSSASKKKGTFGKSNKILLMSGTKSKMMERSAAGTNKSGTGRVPNGTGTMKERMHAVRTPDLMNQISGEAAEASKTYNNASHLLASVNDIEVSVGDYGNATANQTAHILADITKEEDEDHGGGPMISVFDQLEEMQFMSYELGTKLKSLVETIIQNSQNDGEYFHPNPVQPPEQFMSQIEDIAKEANNDFEMIQQALRSFFDRMQEEVTKWKRRCSKLQSKLQLYLNKPNYERPALHGGQSKNGIQAMMSKSVGRKPTNHQKWVGGLRGLRDKTRSSNSMNHSGKHSVQEERLMLQQSLMDIVNVYDKNRTQIYSNLDEMEHRVHEFKNTREKLNVQHLGTMTTVEQEMESLCLRSARSAKSGNNLKSHRSQSASKRPMTSLDGTKRSHKAGEESEKKQTGGKDCVPQLMSGAPQIKPRAQSSNVRSPINKVQSLVPPLPIHMINSNMAAKPTALQNNNNQKKQSFDKQAPSARSQNGKPPPPESYRSHRSGRSNSHRPPLIQQQQYNSQQHSHRGVTPLDSKRSNQQVESHASSRKNISGAIVEGYVVNQVMLQGAPQLTSKFDNKLESDFSADEATLVFDTGRLKQFTEDYAHLASLEETDQKILMKQWLFFKYERELKQQGKEEKRLKEQRRREQREARNAENRSPGKNKKGSKRHSSHGGSGSQFNVSSRSFKSKASALRNTQNNQGGGLGQLLDMSAIQLDSSLSDIGTTEVFNAMQREKYVMQDAQLSQMLAVSQNISGLKTVTQKDLVEMFEKKHEEMDALKKEDRKVLGWSSSEDENASSMREFARGLQIQTNEKGNGNIDSVTISPSHVQLQVPVKSPQMHNYMVQGKQFGAALQNVIGQGIRNDFNLEKQNNNILAYNSGDKNIEEGQGEVGEGNRDQSFNNDSLVYEDFDQLTPQQVRASNQPIPSQVAQSQNFIRNGQRGNQILSSDQNILNKERAGGLTSSAGPSGISHVASVTANSEESQFYIQQKKSLEVITERQSEFSNTMGTYARPSQRSKKSNTNASASHHKHGNTNHTIQGGSASVLDNSSIHQNSSRHNHGSQHNRHDTQKQVQSFADIAGDPHEDNDVKSYHQKFKAMQQQQNNSQLQMQGFSQIYASVPTNECHSAIDLDIVSNEKEKAKQFMSSTDGKSRKSSKLSKKSNGDQFNDMAAQTPIRSLHPQSRIGQNQQKSETTDEQNSSKEGRRVHQINDKDLLRELKNFNLQQVTSQNPNDLQNQRNVKQQLDMESSSKSYIDQSYLDESDAASNNHPSHRGNQEKYSTVKKKRKRKDKEANRIYDSTPTRGLMRSNSEMYLKNTDMQDQDDAFFVPIMYAAEASPTTNNHQLSQQMSTEQAKVRIDSSMLNNLTRYIEANNSAHRWHNLSAVDRSGFGGDTNGKTLHFSTALYNQIQKLFMQAQQPNATNNLTKGAGTLKSMASSSKHFMAGIGDQPSILKSGLNITSLLDQSTQPQFYKQTLKMLQHLQGYQQHNLNPAVGLLFSNSLQSMTQSQLGKLKNINNTITNASPGQGILQKTSLQNHQMPMSSPIVDHLLQLQHTQNQQQNRSDFKRSLMESIKSIPSTHHHHHSTSMQPDYQISYQKSEIESKNIQDKFKSEVVTKGKPGHNQSNHSRGLSKETVSSYVHQIKRPVTNVGNYHTMSKGSAVTADNSTNQQSVLAYNSATPDLISHKDVIVNQNSSVVLDSHNSLQQIQHLHQKSTDYENSTSIERSIDPASGGLQSQLQKKLKLKSKGMFISESSAKVNQSVNQQKSQGKIMPGQAGRKVAGSVGRQISGTGIASVSASANQGQFKFQLNIKRESSKDSQNKYTQESQQQLQLQQLQSQPQMTQIQQLQLREQQMQSLPQSQISINTGANRSGSSSEQKASVVKRVNIRKIPVKRMVDGKITKSQGIQISRANHVTQIGSKNLQLALQQQSSKQETNNSNTSGPDVNSKLQPVINLSKILVNNANTATQQTFSKSSKLRNSSNEYENGNRHNNAVSKNQAGLIVIDQQSVDSDYKTANNPSYSQSNANKAKNNNQQSNLHQSKNNHHLLSRC